MANSKANDLRQVGAPVVVTRQLSASPEKVFAMVSDLTRMGEWSPENNGGVWTKGATGPAVGAMFKGRNANGGKSWSTSSKVFEFDPPRKIVWALMVAGSRWCDWVWQVEPSNGGSLVTHTWVDRRSKLANWLGGKISKVEDRGVHNRINMVATLDALAMAADK